ncbi:hypothetical protein, partial [Halalkalibacter alkaliphilus]
DEIIIYLFNSLGFCSVFKELLFGHSEATINNLPYSSNQRNTFFKKLSSLITVNRLRSRRQEII